MQDEGSVSGFDPPLGGGFPDGSEVETTWNWPFIIAAAVILAAVLGLSAFLILREEDDAPATTTTTSSTSSTQLSRQFTVEALLAADGQFTPLLSAAEGTGVLELLAGEDEVTLLAPDVDAFGEVDVPEDPAARRALLERHILDGSYGLADLIELDGETVPNLAGDELPVTVAGAEVTVGGATIVKGNIAAQNGYVHVVDAVISA